MPKGLAKKSALLERLEPVPPSACALHNRMKRKAYLKKMGGLYVLLTDTTNCLVVETSSGQFSLPSHKQWPINRKVPKVNWASQLFRHITFGIRPTEQIHFFKQEQPFGIPRTTKLYAAVVSQECLEMLGDSCKNVGLWIYRHTSSEKFPWALKIKPMTIDKLIDLESYQCIRVFNENVNRKISASNDGQKIGVMAANENDNETKNDDP